MPTPALTAQRWWIAPHVEPREISCSKGDVDLCAVDAGGGDLPLDSAPCLFECQLRLGGSGNCVEHVEHRPDGDGALGGAFGTGVAEVHQGLRYHVFPPF